MNKREAEEPEHRHRRKNQPSVVCWLAAEERRQEPRIAGNHWPLDKARDRVSSAARKAPSSADTLIFAL